jgi:hypothetical protein
MMKGWMGKSESGVPVPLFTDFEDAAAVGLDVGAGVCLSWSSVHQVLRGMIERTAVHVAPGTI